MLLKRFCSWQTGMDDGCEENVNASTFVFQGKRYYVTPKRWGILLLSCCILSLDVFCFYFFSFINDMTSIYFNVSPAMTDLLASLNMVGRTVGAIAVCIFSDWMTLRGITVYGSALNSISVLCVAIGVYTRKFVLALLGMFLNGAFSGILITIVQVITMTWFPLHERGKSSAAPWVVRRLTLMLSNIIATRSLGADVIMQAGNVSEATTSSAVLKHFIHQFQTTFTIVFGVIAFMTLLCCVIARIYVTDRPAVCEDGDIPPEELDESTLLLQTGSTSYTFVRQVQDLILIFKDISLIIYFCTFIFATLDNPLGTMLISSLVIDAFPKTTDQIVGIAYCIGIVVGSLGSAMTGQVLDKFAKPQITFICFALFSVVSLAGISLSFNLHILVGVFAFYLLLWFSRDALVVCILHRLAEMTIHRTHSIRVKTFSIAVTVSSLGIALTAYIIRIIENQSSPAVGVLYSMPFLVLSIVSYVVFWPHFRAPMARDKQ